jgi:hypothetical protein
MKSKTHHETITPSSQLPAQAYPQGTSRHEPVAADIAHIHDVNSVQHVIRAAVSEEGLRAAERVVRHFKDYEAEHLVPDISDYRAALEHTDQFLVNEFEPKLRDLEAIVHRRKQWYDALLAGEYRDSISDLVSRAQNLSAELAVTTVGPTATSIHPKAEYLDSADLHTPPGEFGYEPPHTFLAVWNRHQGSAYPLIPWCGTVVCLCPYKRTCPHMPCCKHELFIAANSKRLNIPTQHLPSRYTQIVSAKGKRLYHDLYEQ